MRVAMVERAGEEGVSVVPVEEERCEWVEDEGGRRGVRSVCESATKCIKESASLCQEWPIREVRDKD